MFFGLNKVSEKSFYFLINSIESSLKRTTSLWVISMIGMIVSKSRFSTNGLSTFIVAFSLVAYDTYFIAKFRVLDPTN